MAKKTKAIVVKRPVGRPEKYGPAILKQTEEYLNLCQDGYRRIVQSKGRRSVMYGHERVVKVPTLGGLARFLRIDRTTIYDWAKKNREFSHIIGDLMSEQEDRLINNGLSGDYNPTIAKVLLTKHGYREGVEHANPDGTNLFRPSEIERGAAEKALREA